jgi:hypothetical protein
MPLPYQYFVKTSTIVGAPSDSNDGRDPLGCALSNATYDHTGGGSGERQLTAASGTPFSSVQAGDYIYLLNAVGGVANGLYTIASVPSSTVILLEDDSGLTADSTADVDSSNGPLLTETTLINTTAAAGQVSVICDDGDGTGGDWEPTGASVPYVCQNGGANGHYFQGGNSRGVVDGTKAVLSAVSLDTGVHLMTPGIGTKMMDIIFKGRATGTGQLVHCGGSRTLDHNTFIRCEFIDSPSDAITNTSDFWNFVDCLFADNVNKGVDCGTTAPRGSHTRFVRCRFRDNGLECYDGASDGLVFEGCLFFGNGTGTGDPAIRLHRLGADCIVDGCVFYNNAGSGVGYGASTGATSSGVSITNSIFKDNGAYGVDASAYGWAFPHIDYCCFHGNTSGAVASSTFIGYLDSTATGGLPEPIPGTANCISSDPLFESVTAGSEDFTPKSTSPCLVAGIDVPVR